MPFLSPLPEGTVPGVPYPLNPACPVDGGQPEHPLCTSGSSVSCTSHPIQPGISCSTQGSTRPAVQRVLCDTSCLTAVWCPAQCTTHPAPCILHPMLSTGHVVSRCC